VCVCVCEREFGYQLSLKDILSSAEKKNSQAGLERDEEEKMMTEFSFLSELHICNCAYEYHHPSRLRSLFSISKHRKINVHYKKMKEISYMCH